MSLCNIFSGDQIDKRAYIAFARLAFMSRPFLSEKYVSSTTSSEILNFAHSIIVTWHWSAWIGFYKFCWRPFWKLKAWTYFCRDLYDALNKFEFRNLGLSYIWRKTVQFQCFDENFPNLLYTWHRSGKCKGNSSHDVQIHLPKRLPSKRASILQWWS